MDPVTEGVQFKADPRLTEKNSPEIKLAAMSQRIEEIYVSVEKTRKYFLWTLIITAVTIILPLIALIFVIPIFLSQYQNLGL